MLVPRKHLSSDIFGLNDHDYVDIITAAHTVAQHLKAAFGAKRCGMIFEGYEIDYAHVKLIPVHEQAVTRRYILYPYRWTGFLPRDLSRISHFSVRATCVGPWPIV